MILSHPKECNIKEKSLFEHLKNVGELSKSAVQKLKLNLNLINKHDLIDLAYLIGISHDFGKSTSFFQVHLTNKKYKGKETYHALISGIFCYYMIKEKFKSDFLAIISYLVIKRHHGNLETIQELDSSEIHILKKQLSDIRNTQFDEILNIYNNLLQSCNLDFKNIVNKIDFDCFIDLTNDFEEIIDEIEENNKIELFLLTNLLFSVLIDSDKKDAARLELDYFEGNDINEIINIQEYINYKRTNEPNKFSLDKPINKLRNKFINDILNNNDITPENHFYTLSAPTGIGKTFAAFGFANKLKEQLDGTKIIYCLPYTSIIDQNFDELEKILKYKYSDKYNEKPEKYLLRHHYLTPKIIRNRKDSNENSTLKDYMDDKLLVEAWESSNIVTTFIQIFYSIIGYKNSFLKKFHNIINSIIILDEVQVLDPKYYRLVKEIFNILGERFNTYFLLLTATQPKILDENKVVKLIKDENLYFKDNIFNRVQLSINLNPQTLNEFYNIFYNKIKKDSVSNSLIVFNTKKSAINFYNKVKLDFKNEYNLFCLTTNLTPHDRLNKIDEIKELLKKDKKLILISTQLIEAGVDLSFEYVYRDFGLLDSIIQVAGRCNRNGELFPKKGKMFLLRLKDDENDRFFYKYIYKDTIFEQWIIESLNNKYEFESKDFIELSNTYFNKFDFKSLSKQFLDSIYKLNYNGNNKPIKDFCIIEDLNYQETIVICQSKEIEEYINELNTNYYKLKKSNIKKDERENYLLNLLKVKNKIIPYQISISTNDLQKYIDADIIKIKDEYNNIYISYVSFENQKKYIYDVEIGFLIEPKNQLPGILNF